MKNLLKTFITTILTAAIVITGISTTNTTVTAATKTGTFTNGSSVTLKPGDSMKLLVQDKDGEDDTEGYKWSSSDTSVLKVETDIYDEDDGSIDCVVLIGVSAGTATVTGRGKGLRGNITMTVTVTLPKATAKQKKCKHKFKTTKKATCERAGIKTCKKCKYQKMIAKPDHKYVKKTIKDVEYDYYTFVLECHGDDLKCTFTATIKYDKYGNIAPDSDYPDEEAWMQGLRKHMGENNHHSWGGNAGWFKHGAHVITRTAEICTWCGEEKNREKNAIEKAVEKANGAVEKLTEELGETAANQ